MKNVNKYFLEAKETQKGHMQQGKQGVRSTKINDIAEKAISIQPDSRQLKIMVKVMEPEQMVATDQMGKFPVEASSGAQYIIVLSKSDGNLILVATMNNQTEGEMIRAYTSLMKRLHAARIRPKHKVLDNEASDEYKDAIKANEMTYELVPLDMHRHKKAEKVIQTFKDHFVAILSGVDESFPMHLSDRLLPQAEMTLNLLQQANVAPKVLAYAYMNGPHDYSKCHWHH